MEQERIKTEEIGGKTVEIEITDPLHTPDWEEIINLYEEDINWEIEQGETWGLIESKYPEDQPDGENEEEEEDFNLPLIGKWRLL